MKKLLVTFLLLYLVFPSYSFAAMSGGGGGGTMAENLEMGNTPYSIDGGTNGLYFDPDNDGVVETVISTTGGISTSGDDSQTVFANGKMINGGNTNVIYIDAGFNYGVDAGATDAYAITITGITAVVDGMPIMFKAATANTGACTLNLNALGAVDLKSLNNQDPADSYIEAGSIVWCVYDSTTGDFQILSPDANP